MKTIALNDYFNEIGYDWEKNKDAIIAICKMTKSRVRPEGERFMWGWEQQFLIDAIAKKYDIKKFFEIGTGRGTTSYVVSFKPDIEEIVTLDTVPFDVKQDTAVNWIPARLSMKDFFDAIMWEGKHKIKFLTSESVAFDSISHKDHFDLAFIDGNHTNFDIIMVDFHTADFVTDGPILFDDYNLKGCEAVTQVVDSILEKGEHDATLVEFRGHLFEGSKKPESGSGMIILEKK